MILFGFRPYQLTAAANCIRSFLLPRANNVYPCKGFPFYFTVCCSHFRLEVGLQTITMATFRPRLSTVFVIISAAFITLTLLSLDLQTYFFTIGKYGSKAGQDNSESISVGVPSSLDASSTSGSASQLLDAGAKASAEAKVKFARTVELLERLHMQDYIPKFM